MVDQLVDHSVVDWVEHLVNLMVEPMAGLMVAT